MYARLTALLMIVAVVALWVVTIGPAGSFATGIGRYSVELLAVNVLVSYLALLSCYVVLGREAWKRRAARAILSLAAVLFTLLLVELPAAPGLLDYRAVLFPRLTDGKGPDRVQRDPELIFRHPPHSRFQQQEVEYRYDEDGFRNATDLERAPVVLIGDSFVEGYAIPYEKICSTQLGRMLGVDVCNLGHDDYGPPQELIVLRNHGLGLRPRVVVWFFFEGNDLIDLEDYQKAVTGWRGYLTRGNSVASRCFCLNALELVDLWMEQFRWQGSGLRRNCSARLLPDVRDDDVTMYFGGYFSSGAEEVSTREQALLEKTQEILQEAKSICALQGIHLLVTNVPTKFRVYGDLCVPEDSGGPVAWQLNDLPDRLARWCAAAGIEYLDLTPALKSAAREGPLVYLVDDGHWSARGHAVVAEEIARFIRTAEWLNRSG